MNRECKTRNLMRSMYFAIWMTVPLLTLGCTSPLRQDCIRLQCQLSEAVDFSVSENETKTRFLPTNQVDYERSRQGEWYAAS